jgi:hypothetical protein
LHRQSRVSSAKYDMQMHRQTVCRCSTLPTLTLILCKVAEVLDKSRLRQRVRASFPAPVVVRAAGSSGLVEGHLRSGAASSIHRGLSAMKLSIMLLRAVRTASERVIA